MAPTDTRHQALLRYLAHRPELLAHVHSVTAQRLEGHPEREEAGFALVAEDVGAQVREELVGPLYDAEGDGPPKLNWLELPEL
jgi:hypothetical protein